jgi:putative ABC transport system permease protein
MASTKAGAINGMDVFVKGVSGTFSKTYDDHIVRLPLKTAQKLLRTENVHTLTLYLDETEKTDETLAAIEKLVQARHLDWEVRPWYKLPGADFVVKLTAFYSKLYLVFKLIILIVVIFGIFNTMNMSVLERIGEIGTLMAMGTPRKDIIRFFITEGFILGVIGGFFGMILGYGLAYIISQIGITMPTAPGSTALWIARIKVVPAIFREAYLLSIVTALISSVLPAIRASRFEIAEALRHNV